MGSETINLINSNGEIVAHQKAQSQQTQIQHIQTIEKYKIKRLPNGCSSTAVGYLSKSYPVEMLNCLSNEEYLFIIEKFNKITRSHKNFSAMITIFYCVFMFILTIPLIIGTVLSSLWPILSYLALSILSIILYIVLLLKRVKKTGDEVISTVDQLNLVYSNRNIKLESKKSSTNFSKAMFDLSIYYPSIQMLYIQQQAPQMYNTTTLVPQTQQQPQQTQYMMYSPQPTQQVGEKSLSYKINNNNQNEKTPLL